MIAVAVPLLVFVAFASRATVPVYPAGCLRSQAPQQMDFGCDGGGRFFHGNISYNIQDATPVYTQSEVDGIVAQLNAKISLLNSALQDTKSDLESLRRQMIQLQSPQPTKSGPPGTPSAGGN
jgi:hypothetical protein